MGLPSSQRGMGPRHFLNQRFNDLRLRWVHPKESASVGDKDEVDSQMDPNPQPLAEQASEQQLASHFDLFCSKSEREWTSRTGFAAGLAGLYAGFYAGGPVGALVGAGLASVWVTRASRLAKRTSDEPALPQRRRLRLLERWARLQLEELRIMDYEDTVERRLLLCDYLISAFTPWVRELLKTRTSDARAHQTAAAHLKGLLRLLRAPCVATEFHAANKIWEERWLRECSHPGDAPPSVMLQTSLFRRRVDKVLPTLASLPMIAAAQSSKTSHTVSCVPNFGGANAEALTETLVKIANWSADFLTVHGFPASLESPQTPPLMPRNDSLSSFYSCLSDDDTFALCPEGAPPAGAENDSDCDRSDSDDDPASEPGFPRSPIEKTPPLPGAASFMVRGAQEHGWKEVDSTVVMVRGPAYLEDKAKIQSGPSLLKLIGMDLYRSADGSPLHAQACTAKGSLFQKLRSEGEKRFLVLLNWRLNPVMSLVGIWAAPLGWENEVSSEKDTPASRLFRSFVENFSDSERNAHFKVIPAIREASFLVRQAVPEKPVILGRKLSISYFHVEKDSFEIFVDVHSSVAAQFAVRTAIGGARRLTLDVSWVVEGQKVEDLPENVCGAFRVCHVDITRARPLI